MRAFEKNKIPPHYFLTVYYAFVKNTIFRKENHISKNVQEISV